MNLVYFSPVPWNSFSQRPHYFVRWYQSRFGVDVCWIDPYPSRFPKLADFDRLAYKFKDWQGVCPDWLHVIRPRLLPIEPLKKLAWINRTLWRMQIWLSHSAKLSKCKNQSVRIVIGKPSDIALVTATDYAPDSCLYDMMDDIGEFHTGKAKERLRDVESVLIDLADTVWTSSNALLIKTSALHKNVVWVPNGFENFTSSAVGNDHQSLVPIAGYVGTIGDWFDWQWLGTLAAALPDYRIEIIGPVYTAIPDALPPNVVMLEAMPHSQALARMRNFRLALIPFKVNNLTQCVDPIKYYEYKAMGLPILSTDFGDMKHHKKSPGVFICDNESTIRTAVALAKAYVAEPLDTDAFVKKNGWYQRFDAASSWPRMSLTK